MSGHRLQKIETRFQTKIKQDLLSEIFNYLDGFEADNNEDYLHKEKEEEKLLDFINRKSLWYDQLKFSIYLSEGAEQKVFYDEDKTKVIKFNDGIFYVNWTQYFESIIIHNILFSETSYRLQGFLMINKKLFAVLEQEYIEPTDKTNILDIQKTMTSKGFFLKRRNDYVNNELGLIIEDLHEENVLVKDGVLFFIDTVIYLK
jgi:hypothetical protein